MKKLLLALLLLAAAFRANATDYTDMWNSPLPTQQGYGFSVIQSDDGTGHPYLFIVFYVYGPNGQPTWYVAGVTWNGTDSFTGDVYTATGTYFGAPWVGYTATKVGTATFKPNLANNYQATFSFTAGGVGASYAIERQTLTANATGGSYIGAQSGVYSGCNTAGNNGSYTDSYDATVTHNADNSVTYQFNYNSGLTCTLTGTYVQNGQYLRVPNATYSCSDGVNTTGQMTEIRPTSLGLEGRFHGNNVGDNCAEDAIFGGPLL